MNFIILIIFIDIVIFALLYTLFRDVNQINERLEQHRRAIKRLKLGGEK